jgi:hypothetical protein
MAYKEPKSELLVVETACRVLKSELSVVKIGCRDLALELQIFEYKR